MNTVQDKLEQIKADIASEKLTYPQIRERLETLIEHEYSKEGGPDVDLVIACEDLLWRLGTDNAPFVTHEDQYKEAIKSRIEASQRTRQIKKPVLRFVAALVVVVLLLGGAEVFLHREWLEQSDTEDQQQHIVQGFKIDTGLVEKAIVTGQGVRKLSTADYQEVRDFLGFDLPDCIFFTNWDIQQFVVSIHPTFVRVFIHYISKDTSLSELTLDTRIFSDTENAFVTFEQEREGTIMDIAGSSVYFVRNKNNNGFIWVKDNCEYALYGNIPSNLMKDIVEIIGGKSYE